MVCTVLTASLPRVADTSNVTGQMNDRNNHQSLSPNSENSSGISVELAGEEEAQDEPLIQLNK